MATTTAPKTSANKNAKPATGKAKRASKKASVAKKTTSKVPTRTAAAQAEDFAVIESGGKQHMVSVGDILAVELLPGKQEGDTVEFDRVLMTDNGKDTTIGTPYIKGAKVRGTYQEEKKGKKLSIVRFESKSNRSRKVGHRQRYALVQIDSIE